jgi:hypothetical protein
MKTRSSLKIAGALCAALATTACVSGPSGGYSEGANYNGQRDRIQNQPIDCTIVTERGGTVRGGTTTQVGDGSWRERCVSSPYANQRQAGTNPIQQEFDRAQRDIARDVSNEVRRAVRSGIRDALSF